MKAIVSSYTLKIGITLTWFLVSKKLILLSSTNSYCAMEVINKASFDVGGGPEFRKLSIWIDFYY